MTIFNRSRMSYLTKLVCRYGILFPPISIGFIQMAYKISGGVTGSQWSNCSDVSIARVGQPGSNFKPRALGPWERVALFFPA